ncbi:MAG: 16S rRNA (guanine(527)-N(7))-methyltransferase RsmG [Anaerosomatales bacterium]|nr:16S rRNA (guanine(527)-N(7))-methyltransferase RsmG [Anaerosomatales bacterium]
MKHDDVDSRWLTARNVLETLQASGIEVDHECARLLCAHAAAVLEANRRFNLTSITDPRRFVVLHIADSLAVLPAVQETPEGSGIDIGTGAGYPGLPLALVTGRAFTLLDGTGKKAAFLKDVCADLGLSWVEPIGQRAEEFAAVRPSVYALAVSRAVGSLATVVELAAPLLARAGRLIAYKGQPDPRETARGDEAAEVCGMRRVGEVRYRLESTEERVAFVYEKVSEPKVELPRRPGMASRKPLP